MLPASSKNASRNSNRRTICLQELAKEVFSILSDWVLSMNLSILQHLMAAIQRFKAGLSYKQVLREEADDDEYVDQHIQDVGAIVDVSVLSHETIHDNLQKHVDREYAVQDEEENP